MAIFRYVWKSIPFDFWTDPNSSHFKHFHVIKGSLKCILIGKVINAFSDLIAAEAASFLPFRQLSVRLENESKAPPYLFIINRVLFDFLLRLQQLVLKATQKHSVCLHLLKRKEKATA